MAKVIGLTGDEAVAYAVKQCDVDVIAAYPITPQTVIVETLGEFVANGELDAEMVHVESEHSALSVVTAAALTGARVFTATCSQGLALMFEILYITSGVRAPVVMAVANRALSAPINIHADHSDSMGARDSGWIQLYAENVQEVYDMIFMAYKIAENRDVLLPTMVCLDGFTLTHTLERVEMLDDEVAKKYLPPKPTYPYPISAEKPATYGSLALPDYYFEFKMQQQDAMNKAKEVIPKAMEEFSKVSGREYDQFKAYAIEDADVITVALGSTGGTMRSVARELRKQGYKVGSLTLRVYRPFPAEALMEALSGAKVILAMDRTLSFGAIGGPLFEDLRTLFYDAEKRPLIADIVYGLGGRDLTPAEAKAIFKYGLEIAKSGRIPELVKYVGVRE
ncbi:MAG: pyruvate ferredoxin oxidoreductase [Thermoprotei archaeon]|nr:MAG: pyruvate ferredoxin oxidoreductase [Thermoprotei archaeon]RLF20285.1 MAG: pyruvate ferredoxin oxidoreductase [Thermoprotei archaeon]